MKNKLIELADCAISLNNILAIKKIYLNDELGLIKEEFKVYSVKITYASNGEDVDISFDTKKEMDDLYDKLITEING